METDWYLEADEHGPHCKKQGGETESLQGASDTSQKGQMQVSNTDAYLQ